MTTVRSFLFAEFIPKSPYHVPVSGCPSWAMAEAAIIQAAASKKATRKNFINPPLRYVKLRVIDLGLTAQHEFGAVVVILADVFKCVCVGLPSHRKHLRRPGLRVSAGIIDSGLILQRVHVRTSEAFGEFQ